MLCRLYQRWSDNARSRLRSTLTPLFVAGWMTFGLYLALSFGGAAKFPAVSSEACLGTKIPTLISELKKGKDLLGIVADVRKADLKFVVSRGNYDVIGSGLDDEEIKKLAGNIRISIYEILPSKDLISLVRHASVLVMYFDDSHKLIASECSEVLDAP